MKFRALAQRPDPNAVDKRLDERDGWVDLVLDFQEPSRCPTDTSIDSAVPPSELGPSLPKN